jgi:hypothetical protein
MDSMVRQLGAPTFFVTFTNAESRRTALISSLHMLNKKYMDILENFDELEYKHMGDLVQSNLATCAHYYNHCMVAFCNLKIKNSSIFGKVNDFNFVIEFQNRGSEHDHSLLCIEDGPICGVDSNEMIEQFVDKYVTLNISLLPSHLQDSQMHKHR